MCGGGGPRIRREKAPAATINVPDYGAYDKQFELQKAAIDAQIQGSATKLQDELNASFRSQTKIKEELAELAAQKAKDEEALQEKAARLSVLMGPPPPEKTASAPEIGVRDRDIKTRKGKKALRIGRKVARQSGQGTGLNIT